MTFAKSILSLVATGLVAVSLTGCTDDTKNEIIAQNGNYMVKMPYMSSTRDTELKVSNNEIQKILEETLRKALGAEVKTLSTCKKVLIMMKDNSEHLMCKKDGKEEGQIELINFGKIIKKPN